jgi:acyl-CoA synthetase (AMP-forming)/AMP-acid ligase II
LVTAAADPPLHGQFETVADAMDAAAEQFATREAYVAGERIVTFGEWLRAADGVASGLVQRGVRPGDVVAIAFPPSIEYAIAFAAITRMGAVATGVNTRLGPREVEAIFAKAQPAAAFLASDRPLPGIPPATPTLDGGWLDEAAAGAALGRGRHAGRASDPAVIIWTSGTTGLPKGAWFDHVNLLAAASTAGVMTEAFDRRLVGTPMAHAGYMAKLWEQLAWATTLVLSPVPWAAADMCRLLVSERITVAGAVPAQWAKLLELPQLDGADLSALRLAVAATAPAPPELVERVIKRCRCPLVVRYAMTESPSITGTRPGDRPETLYRTVGRPQAGVDISIRDEDGSTLPAGTIGRIHVRGVSVMRGYWREPELTAAVLSADGWLRSGDLGRIDEDGNLVLAGRVGDMYIRGGYNVHPLEVENVIVEHPAVDAVAVLGAPVPVLGEVGVAFVVPAPGAVPPTLDELRAWCRARLADYKAPDRLVVVGALPQTPMMKVDKEALRALSPPS